MEELSAQNAQRNDDRMIRDVQASARLSRPPRMAPPLSARESSVAEDAEAPLPAEPTVTTTTSTPAPPPGSTNPKTIRALLDGIDAAGDAFYRYTTPEERARVRRATTEAPLERAVQSNPTSSLLCTSVFLEI